MYSAVLIATIVLGSREGRAELIERGPRLASRIFAGFAYVGESSGVAHVNSSLPLRLDSRAPPVGFVAGRQYIFHHPLPTDQGMTLAQQVLAPRLQAEGFKLTETVNGIFYEGFIALDLVGGGGITIFGIQFKRAGCMGVINYYSDEGIRRNSWTVVRGTWDPAAYDFLTSGECQF